MTRFEQHSILFFLAILGCLPAAGCGPSALPGKPNVIIYLVDTLRVDHLGVYGYERDTSPELDRFARDAVVFDNAYSPTSWTKPACLSVLTGLNPPRHRAVTRPDTVSEEITLLSEYLQPNGYHTVGMITNPNLIPLWGFDQGYDAYLDIDATGKNSRADKVNESAFAQLDKRPDKPFFFYIHTMDPHGPLKPPPPYDTMFPRFSKRAIMPSLITEKTKRKAVKDAVSAYDGEIAYNDHHFGRLMERLKEDGLYDDALIVFVADHGEEFKDHGKGGHGHTLYQELVHVPMIIKLPGNELAGKRVEARVSLVDIVPTVLSCLNQSIPETLDGVDILPLMRGQTSRELRRPLYLDLDMERANGTVHVIKGVLDGPLKYVRREGPKFKESLFNIITDPDERNDLIESHEKEARKLAALLDEYTMGASTGVHLRLINANNAPDRVCIGELRTEGRFTSPDCRQFEGEDEVELSADNRTLSFKVHLRNYPHPTGGVPERINDEDSFSFNVDPIDAKITVHTLCLDTGESLPLFAGPTRKSVESLPFTLDPLDTDWVVQDIALLLYENGRPIRPVPFGAYLAVVPTTEQELDLPEEVLDRLRETGYIGK